MRPSPRPARCRPTCGQLISSTSGTAAARRLSQEMERGATSRAPARRRSGRTRRTYRSTSSTSTSRTILEHGQSARRTAFLRVSPLSPHRLCRGPCAVCALEETTARSPLSLSTAQDHRLHGHRRHHHGLDLLPGAREPAARPQRDRRPRRRIRLDLYRRSGRLSVSVGGHLRGLRAQVLLHRRNGCVPFSLALLRVDYR